MSLATRDLYRSPNGDRWSLVREPGSGRVLVRHEPNRSSGGLPSDIEVGDFLVRGGLGPEKQELLRVLDRHDHERLVIVVDADLEDRGDGEGDDLAVANGEIESRWFGNDD